MAIAPTKRFDRPEMNRRVRHPLQALRGYIRAYVALEGTGVALIYFAAWFWISLALDYGIFRLFAFDWIQELNLNLGAGTAVLVRVVLLVGLSAGLLALVAFKVFLRLFREFRDPTVALVLERRFPRELGDRLITAVELADPRLSARYGYSQAMVDSTIGDAADRVERLPVSGVFNWARLRFLWVIALLLTVGVYLLVALGSCTLPALFEAEPPTPGEFVHQFSDVGAIWFERHILLQDSYWPRSAYLEVIRFQDTDEHPGEMRVGRDEQRPDVLVRAVKWVLADRNSPDGWRALRWSDLPAVLGRGAPEVALSPNWPDWIIDLDDLDKSIPTGLLPTDWQGKKSGLIRAELAQVNPGKEPKPKSDQLAAAIVAKQSQARRRDAIARAGAGPAIEALLDWHAWTIDKIELQIERREVRDALRTDNQEASLKAFEGVLSELARLACEPPMSRTLRQLEIPSFIRVYYRGKTTKSSNSHDKQEAYKYTISLAELKESVRFTVQGEDYFTPPLAITLVPPPSISQLKVTKEEPAYLYYRLQGDQTPLKGKRQIFRDQVVSITGESSSIQVPLGSSVTVMARADRDLRDDVRMTSPAHREEPGSVTPTTGLSMLGDGRTFVTKFAEVTKTLEFDFEFSDRDNVKGRRRVLVKPIDDRPPEILDVEMGVVLRKPRFKAEAGKSGGPAPDGFLVTPRALIPFKGTIRDDYGLAGAAWTYEVEPVEFELIGDSEGGKSKGPLLLLTGNPAARRARYVASGLHFLPAVAEPLTVAGWAWIAQLVKVDIALAAKRKAPEEGSVPLERLQKRLEDRAGEELTLNDLLDRLGGPLPKDALLKEHSLKEEDGFDFNKYLAKLQSMDPQKEAQLHYQVRLVIKATDNNVETGPSTGRTKMPLNFLIVSENELLGQILVEEDALRERLEKAVDVLKNHKTVLDEQVGKLEDAKSDLGLVGIRAEEVRKSVLDGASAAREVYADYSRILRELEANRVAPQKIKSVDTQICEPLQDMIHPTAGEFALLDDMVQKLSQDLERDSQRQKAAADAKEPDQKLLRQLAESRLEHLESVKKSREIMTRLIERLDSVLRAMDKELVLGNLINGLLEVERTVRRQAELIRRYQEEVIQDLFNSLGDAIEAPKKR